MPKYLILDPEIVTRSPTNRPIFSFNAIIGTIIARSKVAATKRAIELTGMEDPIALVYSELDESELEMARLAPILDAPAPVGRPSSGHRRSLTLTGLTDEDVEILDNVECKGAFVVGLIRKNSARVS
jgi:hypothetical protein